MVARPTPSWAAMLTVPPASCHSSEPERLYEGFEMIHATRVDRAWQTIAWFVKPSDQRRLRTLRFPGIRWTACPGSWRASG